MEVQRQDLRPTSMLGFRTFNPQMMLGGAIFTILAHGALPLVAALVLSGLAASGLADDKPTYFIDDHIIAASFVQLGKKPDPEKLPQRKVPRLQTAPDETTVVSKNMDPPKPDKPDAGVRPEHPVEDDLLRLGDRAQAFAEIADEMEREGHPDGLVDGTETEAKLGDLYRGKLVSFFKRGWTVPTTMGDASQYKATSLVEITRDLHVGPFSITQSSGEPLFDQSIEDRLNQLRSQGTTLPEPPPEVAHEFLGKKIKIRWKK